MRSVHLGSSQNATPATSSNTSKPQNISTNKTNPPPPLLPPSLNNNDRTRSSTKTPTSLRTVWSATRERGQAILCNGSRPTAKTHPHITTILTTRSTCKRTAKSSTASPPLTLSLPSPQPHTTNPSANNIASTPLAARRPPLKLRDQNQNVAPVLAPVLKETRKMGYETSMNPSTTSTTTSTRQQMPSLSATAAARGINRPPLTPKIASASRPQPQPQSQPQPKTPSLAAVATTPLPRRTQQRPVSTIADAAANSSRSQYDDPSPVSAATFSPHLSSNITPRSGSRQSRVDSASSTPNGTPNPDRSDVWDPKSSFPFSSPLNQGDSSRRPLVTFSAVSPERSTPMRQDIISARESKFFHASDAKTARPTSASRTASSKSPTFFYANGNGITPKTASPAALSPPLSPGLNQSQENLSSKFMYANGTPDLRPTPPPLVSRRSGSTVSTASKGPTVRSTMALQRPVSPSKLPLHSQPSYRNSTGPQSTTTRVQISPPPPLGPSPPGLRRPGTATSRSSGHSRSGSLVKGEGVSDVVKPISSPISGVTPPANLSPTKPPPLTLASIIQAAEEFAEHETDVSPDDQSALQSPTKSTFSSTDQIRNASLEAINRTLERQLRKQTAELRRYRRLSRSGRLSLASTTMSSRVPSGTLSELELESVGLSDLSEEGLDVEDMEDESFSDTDSASSSLSPSVLDAHDAKHRQRDEQRLNLDLSKHQQILIDSQKINQSIKRCLDWSEELIKDGKKALEYKVRVSDVKLGGRVLDPLDEEEEHSRLLLPNDMAAPDTKPIEVVSEASITWGVEPQDRDSGIELPGDGG